MKAVQYFTPEYLEQCKKMTLEERVEYLDNFRLLVAEVQMRETQKQTKSKLISIKMPEDLLNLLKQKAALEDIPYQALIKKLLRNAL